MKINNDELNKVFETISNILDERIPKKELKVIFSILSEMKSSRLSEIAPNVLEQDIKPFFSKTISDLKGIISHTFLNRSQSKQSRYAFNQDEFLRVKNKLIIDTSKIKKQEDKIYYILKNSIYTSSYLASVKFGLGFSLRLKGSIPFIVLVMSSYISKKIIAEVNLEIAKKIKENNTSNDFTKNDLIKAHELCNDVLEYFELLDNGLSCGLALKVIKDKSTLLIQSPYKIIKNGKLSMADTIFAQSLAGVLSKNREQKSDNHSHI